VERKYKVGDEVEVWSNSHKRWSRGIIEKLEDSDKVSVKYWSPEGAAMIKQMPEEHEHLRFKVAPPAAPPPPAPVASAVPAGMYQVGDKVEIWSQSQQSWCRGTVEKLQGELVNIKYASPDGQAMTKLMPNGHEYLRHLNHQAVPPPPPPPGRSATHVAEVPPPLAESAGREDSAELAVYVEACREDNINRASSAMASQMHGGSPMDSMPSASSAKTKGHRAANHSNTMKGQRDNEVFVAESTSWVPSGHMALCGMPIKANKKQEVALNDDGTPVARCIDTDRCCRCSMPVGSYFDHTCPRCCGIVCLNCLDDVKFIISSYRCPYCGDQQYNEEALKQTLWYLKVYRNAQRAVGAVPILFAGLFGYGPEGVGSRNAKQSCAMEEEEEQPSQFESQKQGPVQAKQSSAHNKGPPPPPPKPKPKAKAASARPGAGSGSGAQDTPEYHTRPPADWMEGAGGFVAGQAGGPSPDPAAVAAALQKAAAAQSSAQQQSQNRGGNPFSSANGQSPFHTRVPPSPMR
jgi:hypothetical protein